jgi:poly(3-hydroxybutyrate) depolymerase
MAAGVTVKDGTHARFGAGPGGSPDAALDATHAIWSFFSSARSVSRPE